MFELFDAVGWPFSKGFDSPVGQVTHVAYDLMTCGGALSKETEADSLHVTTDDKSSRYLGMHSLIHFLENSNDSSFLLL